MAECEGMETQTTQGPERFARFSKGDLIAYILERYPKIDRCARDEAVEFVLNFCAVDGEEINERAEELCEWSKRHTRYVLDLLAEPLRDLAQNSADETTRIVARQALKRAGLWEA